MKTNDILLIGALGIGAYLLLRPKTTVATPTYNAAGQLINPATLQPYQTAASLAQGNSTSSIVSAAGNALPGIINAISNAF